MAKHEFGLMDNTPQRGKRYDEYEPQKYNCISAFKGKCELAELTNLFEKAVAKNKWIIHFGL